MTYPVRVKTSPEPIKEFKAGYLYLCLESYGDHFTKDFSYLVFHLHDMLYFVDDFGNGIRVEGFSSCFKEIK